MAGDDDARSPAPEDDDDDDQFHDPYNDFGQFTEENIQNVMADPNPNLLDFDVDFNVSQNPPDAPKDSNMEIDERILEELSLNIASGDNNSEFESFDDDLYISWDMFETTSENEPNNCNVQGEIGGNENLECGIGHLATSSLVVGENRTNVAGETTRLEVGTRIFGQTFTNYEVGGPSTRPVPVTPIMHDGILLCGCCQLLRGLVHTNGLEVMRLDIYGETGSFCHAILETEPFGDSNQSRSQSLVLKHMKLEDVRRFIENYLSEREANGFQLVHDTDVALTGFYLAVHAGANNNQPSRLNMLPPNDVVPLSMAMPNAALNIPSVPLYVGLGDEPPKPAKVRPRRNTPLSAQRLRTGKLTLDDLKKYFHLPIEKAAQTMEVCPTVLKKVCRRGGLRRWPYRKIKSLEKRIAALRKFALATEVAAIRETAEKEIAKLEEEIKEIRNDAAQYLKKP
ncbi:hypothetical protein AALP_AA8G169800 [Arabis alpina]|uniref:RWP-RK domain-containing protein n=1 Tax=Arabis alpina TaxID=50452 RepID=A0A087G7J5_ARAAL|nr:hypothetical protein AALP_AA8G169800 [Arabis alpina]